MDHKIFVHLKKHFRLKVKEDKLIQIRFVFYRAQAIMAIIAAPIRSAIKWVKMGPGLISNFKKSAE